MKFQRNAVGMSVMVLSVVTLVLAGSFAYYYTTTQDQISNLKQSGHSYCLLVDSVVTRIIGTFSNVTQTLQQQIQSDESSIATLNATQPAGYQGVIASLNKEIAQDQDMIGEVNGFTSLQTSTPAFCASVSQP